MASFALVFMACEPIVDEMDLKNNTTEDAVELVATQTTAGGNEITLSMNTPGVTGYWDYVLGQGLTDEVTFTFPVTGTFEFTYVGTLGAEFFEKTVSVTVEVLDKPVAPEWRYLLGDDAVAGKTWVYSGTAGTSDLMWYMSPPDSPDSWASIWWNANECCNPDGNGKMHFDLNGGPNYMYYADASGGPTSSDAFYALNTDSGTIRILGSNVLGGNAERGNANGEYIIISLTEDEMILYTPRTAAGDSGWTYIYRPE